MSWSADSRLLVSGSKDSTMKVWDAKTLSLKFDLPGHADEVQKIGEKKIHINVMTVIQIMY